jgi:hypothetical protein
VQEFTWPQSMSPPSGVAFWNAATFMLLFDKSGLVGKPLLVNSSGLDAVDEDLLNKLQQQFSHQTFPAGSYNAIVGP